MPVASIIAITSVLQALLAILPEIEGAATAVATSIELLLSGKPPTPAQQAQIDAALDAAHKAAQAA